MKMHILFILVILTTGFVKAQTKETRNLPVFTRINFRVPGTLTIRQGSPQKIELQGDREILSKIETDVEGNKLVIGKENRWSDWNWSWRGQDKISVTITVKDLDGISVSGSGDVYMDGKLLADALELTVSGSGSLKIESDVKGDMEANVSGSGRIEVKGTCRNYESSISGSGKINAAIAVSQTAEVTISGSGKIEASGTAQQIKAQISGSGKVYASNLEVEKCEVRISGSGDIEINVKSDIDARISGSGSVTYKGNPGHVNCNASGSGHIRKM